MSTPPLVGWRLTYCFTYVHVGVGLSVIPITKGNPAQIFWEACFVFPRELSPDFCYDLDLLLSRSSRESVFHRNGFFLNFVKSTRGILITRVRKLHRHRWT